MSSNLFIPLNLSGVSGVEVEKALQELRGLEGVERVILNRMTETLLVRYRPGLISDAGLIDAVGQRLPLDGRPPTTQHGTDG